MPLPVWHSHCGRYFLAKEVMSKKKNPSPSTVLRESHLEASRFLSVSNATGAADLASVHSFQECFCKSVDATFLVF